MSGTPRPIVVTGQAGPGEVPPRALAEARESFLFSDPGWLAATDHAVPAARPFHTIARRRGDEYAILAAYLVEAPGGRERDSRPLAPAIDPFTYLGGGTPATAGLSTEDLLPAVVIGSPLGLHSEPFFTFWNERLVSDMITATLDAARAAGAKVVLAPWTSDRLTGLDIAGELRRAGAAVAHWGFDEHVPLTETGPAGAPHAHPLLPRADPARPADATTVRTLNGPELLGHLPALTELVSRSHPRRDTTADPATIRHICAALAEQDAVHAACAFATDAAGGPDRLVAGHVLVHRHPRLYGVWYGRERGGTHPGLDAALLAALPRELGRRLGARHLELGATSSAPGRLPGSRSRPKRTAFLAFDDDVRRRCVPLLAGFGRVRRAAAPDVTPAADHLLPLTAARPG